jgi:hypothetical protein
VLRLVLIVLGVASVCGAQTTQPAGPPSGTSWGYGVSISAGGFPAYAVPLWWYDSLQGWGYQSGDGSRAALLTFDGTNFKLRCRWWSDAQNDAGNFATFDGGVSGSSWVLDADPSLSGGDSVVTAVSVSSLGPLPTDFGLAADRESVRLSCVAVGAAYGGMLYIFLRSARVLLGGDALFNFGRDV